MKESKSQESCHLSEEEDVFDAEGVQVTNKDNSRDFFAISGKKKYAFLWRQHLTKYVGHIKCGWFQQKFSRLIERSHLILPSSHFVQEKDGGRR